MKFRPLKNRILVKPKTQNEKVSAGGIILAPTVRSSTEDGEIIAVGPDVHGLKAGEQIAYLPFTGVKVRIENVEHIIMTEDEVWCAIEN
jgi:co-chaperonin GroES (HSP10)